jgi:peptidoglycan/LPS O-acetylase OafA/YrhL
MPESSRTRTTVRDDSRLRRRTIRYAAAAASAATALLYFGIGAGVLKVVDVDTPDAPGMFEFGVLAGAMFVLGAILLVAFDRRFLWVLGAVLQAGVIVMYVVVSAQRTPPFETWGFLIKVLQAAILAVLVYLVLDTPARAVSPSASDQAGIPQQTKRD